MDNFATSAVWLCAMLAAVGLLGAGVTMRNGAIFVIAASVVAYLGLYPVPMPDWVGLSIALLVCAGLKRTRLSSGELRASLAGICAGLGTSLYVQSGAIWWQAAGLLCVAMIASLAWIRLARPSEQRLNAMAMMAGGAAMVVGYLPTLLDGWLSGGQLAQQNASDAENFTLPPWIVGALMVAVIGGAISSMRAHK